MLYCLNLNCERPENIDGAEFCQHCGTRLLLRNRFRVLRPLGEGGLGKTYLAQDCDKMDESCVVKQLKYDAQGTRANQKIVELFMREAQQLYGMRGQAQIPELIAYFEDGGYFYLVQELVDGEDLEQEKAQGIFDEAKIRMLLADVLPILSFIHQRGVIHRDLKPANIMRRRKDGRLVLIDFGVSRQLSKGLTTVGGITIVGTPGYAPFEQMTEGSVDPGPASDLYSLGVTCFELMSGVSPYPLSLQEGYRWVEGWQQYVPQSVSRELQGVMDGLLKMRSEERFQSADAVLAALTAQARAQKYQAHVAEYEAEYRKIVASQWPLSSYLLEQLGRLKAQWALKAEDVEAVEQPIRDRAEVEYQQRLAQQTEEHRLAQEKLEAERRQVELLRRAAEEQQQQEAFRREAEIRRQQEQETLVRQQRIEEAERQNRESQRESQENPVQPVVQPVVQSVEQRSLMRSRRNFLKFAGLGGVGLAGVVIYQVSKRGVPITTTLNRDSVETSKIETVRVNARGEIVERLDKTVEFFREGLGNGVFLDMVLIPGGTFMMGAPESEANSSDTERPQHQVIVPAFAMGKFEVTQAQWEVVMGNNPSTFKGANRPVEQVSWDEAVEFCQKLSTQTNKDYRLPSEAEWEYACRAGTATPFHFGETITPNFVNYDGSKYPYASVPQGAYRQTTTDVGAFPPNDFGLYDMHGNVWEWCLDHWHGNYDRAPSDGTAWITEDKSSFRVLRGGSWFTDPANCRSAYRDYNSPDFHNYIIGFRVVCSVRVTS